MAKTKTTPAERDALKATKAAEKATAKAERKRVAAKALAEAEAERKTKHDAAMAELEPYGKQISELASKCGREGKTEQDARQKGDTIFGELIKKLGEALPFAKAAGMKMKDLKAKYIGDRLGDTRFKLALRIASGKITHEQVNEEERTKKQTQRAAQTAARAAGERAGQGLMSGMTAARLAKDAAGGDGEARQRLLDAGYTESIGGDGKPSYQEAVATVAGDAAPVVEAPPTQPEPVEAPHVLTAEELSDDALTAFKAACNAHCPNMTDADLKAARVYFVGLAVGKEGWRPKIKKAA